MASAGRVWLQAYAEARRRALQGFLAGEGFSPSITPSAFLDALMAAMTCGTIFDRASYSYASKAIGSLSKIYPIIPESVSPASPAAGGGISVPARCQNHAKSAAVIIL
jgi:hypothetical protein